MKRAHYFSGPENKENNPINKSKKSARRKHLKAVDLREKEENDEENSLASELECPICLHTFTSKVYVCENGHSICGTCYKKIRKKCPVCRIPLKGARNRALERVIALSTLPCIYREHGCDFKGRGNARSAHIEKCVYRPTRCLFHRCYPTCTWHGPPSELMEHLNTHCVVRRVHLEFVMDVYWSYESKERCWKRGKDATFFIPSLDRFYYVSISRHSDDYFHLVVVWLPTTAAAAEDLPLNMEFTIPLEDDQSITYTMRPPRLDSARSMDENVKNLISAGESYIVPIRKWRSQWMQDRGKYYFRISAKWSLKDE